MFEHETDGIRIPDKTAGEGIGGTGGTHKPSRTDVMAEPFQPILDAWALMRGFPAPWFVSGGWAIDLFLEHVTRSHSDIEIGVYRCDQPALRRHLPDWSFEECMQSDAGGTWVAWKENEELRLPVTRSR